MCGEEGQVAKGHMRGATCGKRGRVAKGERGRVDAWRKSEQEGGSGVSE